jgi:hypothetical protein
MILLTLQSRNQAGGQLLSQLMAGHVQTRTIPFEWNAFGINSKFGDVEPLERVVSYLDELTPAAGEALQGSSAPISA